ncbi:hypothetical protein D3C83_06050 [compost metagenome]
MAGADRAAVHEAFVRGRRRAIEPARRRHGAFAGRERPEEGRQPLDGGGLAADHQAIAAAGAPDAAARPDVHVVHAALAQHPRPADVVLVVGIAAVDHDVARLERGAEGGHRLFRRVARRHHHPDGAGRREASDEIVQGAGAGGAGAGDRLHGIRAAVPRDDVVSAVDQAARHVAAHAAETDQA